MEMCKCSIFFWEKKEKEEKYVGPVGSMTLKQ